MHRRFLVTFLRNSFLLFLLVCLGCSAQSVSPNLAHAIERQVRAYYEVAPDVKITIGTLKPSEFPGYDAVSVTLAKVEISHEGGKHSVTSHHGGHKHHSEHGSAEEAHMHGAKAAGIQEEPQEQAGQMGGYGGEDVGVM